MVTLKERIIERMDLQARSEGKSGKDGGQPSLSLQTSRPVHDVVRLPNMWLSYVEVEDLDKSLAKARKLGAQIHGPRMEVPGMGSFAILSDPSGAAFGLWQPAPKRPASAAKAPAKKAAAKKAPATKTSAKKAPARKSTRKS